jgi:hypothetical protein
VYPHFLGNRTVYYHASLKRNLQIMSGGLKLLLQHVPDRGEHLVRYYGWYGNFLGYRS